MTAGIVAAVSCTPEAVSGPVPLIEEATFAASLGVNLTNMTKMSNGVYFQDIPAGNGTTAATGNHLTVHYTGYFTNGTSFDTSIGKSAFGFTIGANPRQVIEGWDTGLIGMKVGGTRKLVIPSALAYGGGGFNGIPPNSILVFNVQLVSIP
jgi:FKBP-type peptidyl-prolyl cis-trans isomerase FkpA